MIPCYCQQQRRTINGHTIPFSIAVVLPEKESNNDKFLITMPKARPVIDISVIDAINSGIIGPDYLQFTYYDSRYWENAILAERYATVSIVDAYCNRHLDAILGFADSYSLATVSKISAGFGSGVPVVTTAGMVSTLGDRKTFPFLTRMQGSYRQMADSIYRLLAYQEPSETSTALKQSESQKNHGRSRFSLGYKNLVLMYHDKRRAVNRPRHADGEVTQSESISSHCYFSLYAIKNFFTEKSAFFKEHWSLNTPSYAFDEELERTPDEVKEWLHKVSYQANGQLYNFLILNFIDCYSSFKLKFSIGVFCLITQV